MKKTNINKNHKKQYIIVLSLVSIFALIIGMFILLPSSEEKVLKFCVKRGDHTTEFCECVVKRTRNILPNDMASDFFNVISNNNEVDVLAFVDKLPKEKLDKISYIWTDCEQRFDSYSEIIGEFLEKSKNTKEDICIIYTLKRKYNVGKVKEVIRTHLAGRIEKTVEIFLKTVASQDFQNCYHGKIDIDDLKKSVMNQ